MATIRGKVDEKDVKTALESLVGFGPRSDGVIGSRKVRPQLSVNIIRIRDI
jgi:hypothetical protein